MQDMSKLEACGFFWGSFWGVCLFFLNKKVFLLAFAAFRAYGLLSPLAFGLFGFQALEITKKQWIQKDLAFGFW